MILADSEIRRRREELVTPFDDSRVQPSSYDLTLHNRIAVPIPHRIIDIREDDPRNSMKFVDFEEFELHPKHSILACTEEVVRCPLDLSARIEGKSSLGRLFLAVHITAGVIDAGFFGQITLEIVNHGPWTIILYPSMPIAQVSYFQMTGPCETPYGSKKLGSHYLGQTGPTPAAGMRGK
jgi:dCTP deaminase